MRKRSNGDVDATAVVVAVVDGVVVDAVAMILDVGANLDPYVVGEANDDALDDETHDDVVAGTDDDAKTEFGEG